MTAPITVRDVAVSDVTFHLNESGPPNAPTILWLHGSGPGATGASNWEWMIGELGDEYHCLAPDIMPVAAAEYFADHLPDAQLEVFEETGHWLQLEGPQRFADLLRTFLKGVEA